MKKFHKTGAPDRRTVQCRKGREHVLTMIADGFVIIIFVFITSTSRRRKNKKNTTTRKQCDLEHRTDRVETIILRVSHDNTSPAPPTGSNSASGNVPASTKVRWLFLICHVYG